MSADLLSTISGMVAEPSVAVDVRRQLIHIVTAKLVNLGQNEFGAAIASIHQSPDKMALVERIVKDGLRSQDPADRLLSLRLQKATSVILPPATMTSVLDDSDRRVKLWATAWWVRSFGPLVGATSLYMDALDGSNEEDRIVALESLKQNNTVNSEANIAPKLLKLYLRNEPRISQMAGVAYTRLAKAEPETVQQLRRMVKEGDYSIRTAAIYGLGRMGEAGRVAVPDIVRLLDHIDANAAQGAEIRNAAMGALNGLGAVARDALPSVVRIFERGEKNLSGSALQFIAAQAESEQRHSLLLKAVRDANPNIQQQAINLLTNNGNPLMAGDASAILAAAGSRHLMVRNTVLQALQHAPTELPRVAETLASNFNSPSPLLRRTALSSFANNPSLVNLRPPSKKLFAMLDDPDKEVRGAVFQMFDPSTFPRDRVNDLVKFVLSGSRNDRELQAAARILSRLAAEDEEIAKLLGKTLDTVDESALAAILPVLNKGGSIVVLQRVSSWLKSRNPRIRASALNVVNTHGVCRSRMDYCKEIVGATLLMVDGGSQQDVSRLHFLSNAAPVVGDLVIPGLLIGLRSGNPEVRGAAARGFGQLSGGVPPSLLTELTNLLIDRDPLFRADIARVIGRIDARAGLKVLQELIRPEQPQNVRIKALDGIQSLGYRAGFTVKEVLAIARNPNESSEMREKALSALQSIGSGADYAIPELVQMLSNSSLRDLSLSVLRAIGPSAAPAIPAIRDLLESSDSENTTNLCIYTLGSIGPAADSARPAILSKLGPKNTQNVRSGAMTALRQIAPASVEAAEAVLPYINPEDAPNNNPLAAVATVRTIGQSLREQKGSKARSDLDHLIARAGSIPGKEQPN